MRGNCIKCRYVNGVGAAIWCIQRIGGASRKCQFQGRGLESEGFDCVENPVENVYNLLYYEVIVKFM